MTLCSGVSRVTWTRPPSKDKLSDSHRRHHGRRACMADVASGCFVFGLAGLSRADSDPFSENAFETWGSIRSHKQSLRVASCCGRSRPSLTFLFRTCEIPTIEVFKLNALNRSDDQPLKPKKLALCPSFQKCDRSESFCRPESVPWL